MLNSDENKVIYIGDGKITRFGVPFKFASNDDQTAQLAVSMLKDGLISILRENIDFQIEGKGEDISAVLVLNAPLPENAKLAILRDVPLLQLADFLNGQYMDMEEFERTFDKIYMAMQQINEKISRAILLDVLSDEEPNNIIAAILEYKTAAQTAANEAIAASVEAKQAIEQAQALIAEAQAVVDELGTLADEINGEIV